MTTEISNECLTVQDAQARNGRSHGQRVATERSCEEERVVKILLPHSSRAYHGTSSHYTTYKTEPVDQLPITSIMLRTSERFANGDNVWRYPSVFTRPHATSAAKPSLQTS